MIFTSPDWDYVELTNEGGGGINQFVRLKGVLLSHKAVPILETTTNSVNLGIGDSTEGTGLKLLAWSYD